jgi:spore coat polysaccharide biosynthesis protein SpsF (cytidylyltransferase family)
MTVTVFIQARLNSSRLPNKIIRRVNKKMILDYLINQISFVKRIKNFYFLIPKKDKKLKEILIKRKINFITGPEKNVLERFYQAYKIVKPKTIIRLTADCPLIDPKIIDKLIKFYKQNNYSYVNLGESYAEGQCAEIFSPKILNFLKKNATSEFEKEHVTISLRKKKNNFKIKTLEDKSDNSKLRYTLDTREDFKVIKKIILSFKNKKYLESDDINNFLITNKEIRKINNHIIRNEKTRNY